MGATDKYVYMGDSLNRRLLRAKLVYAAEATCSIGVGSASSPARSVPTAVKPKSSKTAKSISVRTPHSAVRTGSSRSPAQVCTGWFSAARNYKKVGMKADARRCLGNIVREFPGTAWARRARQELERL